MNMGLSPHLVTQVLLIKRNWDARPTLSGNAVETSTMHLHAKCTFAITIGLLFFHSSFADPKGPLALLRSGSLRGKYVSVVGKEAVVEAYLGVPFAQPPVGPLRLAPPLPATPWEGERDATQQPAMCLQDLEMIAGFTKNISVQLDIPGISEDCLYLNIYTPAMSKACPKLPVIPTVWIHGGGFVLGAASLYDGSALAAYQDVVVVLIQYRLGIMGFLSTGDEHCPGNYGLLDQVTALHWIQENIHSFGGDPGLVTIFGESAGGVSVSLQLLSPLSSGLFHRAIAESGTAMMGGVLNSMPLTFAQMVANMSGCDITSSKTIVECMMQLSEEDIINNLEKLRMIPLGVVIDGVFLTKSREESFQNHEVNKVPFMTGVTDLECGWLLTNFFAPPGWVDGMDREQVAPILSMFNTKVRNKVPTKIAIRDGCLEMMGDILFNIPAIQVANYHRDAGAPTYLYEFQQAPSIIQDQRASFTKSDHGDEIHFVFGACFWNGGHIKFTVDKAVCTEEEQKLALTVMEYWGNFARTGSPNGEGLVEWPQYGEREEYLGLGLEQRVGQRLKGNHFVFMTQTVPEMVQQRHSEL
ncbi:fatty acyl-CoA hydrolase precursor, medium chain-like [Conger conger]|uniref:fatty acyl-CoA hydrolase precursor, medium chain-like n=1 Tax=Conger conger TaxID=82655 RepID=UPI002A5A442D|nr:fatty acyl-CoA hydrolase precursor, medium chain-like [Conger conger]